MHLYSHLLQSLIQGKKTYLASDLHLDHKNILEYCPGRLVLGDTVEKMNLALVERWNQIVRPKDQVLLLGDICLGNKDVSFSLLKKLQGEIHLYSGNHDPNSVIYYDHQSMGLPKMIRQNPEKWEKTRLKMDTYRQRFLDVGLKKVYDLGVPACVQGLPYKIGSLQLKLHHFPYQGDHTEKDRYQCYRPVDNGNLLLCGHVHDLWKFNGRMINVGVDCWDFKPVEIRTAILQWWDQASEEDRKTVKAAK